jgi:hypothetical protein
MDRVMRVVADTPPPESLPNLKGNARAGNVAGKRKAVGAAMKAMRRGGGRQHQKRQEPQQSQQQPPPPPPQQQQSQQQQQQTAGAAARARTALKTVSFVSPVVAGSSGQPRGGGGTAAPAQGQVQRMRERLRSGGATSATPVPQVMAETAPRSATALLFEQMSAVTGGMMHMKRSAVGGREVA